MHGESRDSRSESGEFMRVIREEDTRRLALLLTSRFCRAPTKTALSYSSMNLYLMRLFHD